MTNNKEYPKPPKGIRVLKNGAGYDMTLKRIAYPPGTFGDNPNGVPGSELAQTRWDNTRKALNDAIISQAYANGLNVQNGGEAVAIAASALYQDVLSGNGTLRDRNKVLWDIAKHAGLLKDDRDTSANVNQTQVNIGIDAIREILGLTGGQVIDI